MRLLKPAAVYFALVFGTGFVLGIARVLWLVPQLGRRFAELLEMPLMLVAIVLAARWTIRRFADASEPSTALRIGLLALGLLLLAEITLAVVLQGLSPVEVLVNRDPVSGTVYYAMLIVYALMPRFVTRR
jgi:hypothetical protein